MMLSLKEKQKTFSN